MCRRAEAYVELTSTRNGRSLLQLVHHWLDSQRCGKENAMSICVVLRELSELLGEIPDVYLVDAACYQLWLVGDMACEERMIYTHRANFWYRVR